MSSCRNAPWYAVRCCQQPPYPIETIKRPWIIDQLVSGRGCPDVSRCGTGRRDGDGCGYVLDDPNAPMRRSTEDFRQGPVYGQREYVKNASGTVGLYLNLPGAKQNVQLYTPETLRNYALWWRKQWSMPFQCSGYEGIKWSMGCQGVGKLKDYASGWANQWGVNDLTTADRNAPRAASACGTIGTPEQQDTLTRYFMALQHCMQADDWKQCAERGGLWQLRDEAIREGVLPSVLDAPLGLLGKPASDEEFLAKSIYASCPKDGPYGACYCRAASQAAALAGMHSASWLLTGNGAAFGDRMRSSIPPMVLTDPQKIAQILVPMLQQAWKDTMAALANAYQQTRIALGLPLYRHVVDFHTPTMLYLVGNGWFTGKSKMSVSGPAAAWLLESKVPAALVDPTKADSSMWPWALGFRLDHCTESWDEARSGAVEAAITVYSLLRLEPLQLALKHGLKDIAAMAVAEKIYGSR